MIDISECIYHVLCGPEDPWEAGELNPGEDKGEPTDTGDEKGGDKAEAKTIASGSISIVTSKASLGSVITIAPAKPVPLTHKKAPLAI